jgi:hypothetical protein
MDAESLGWPSAEPSYRLRPGADQETAPVDVFAVVLDATDRSPERVSLRLGIGRRTDVVGPRRVALEGLSGHEDVTVAGDHAIGTVPVTDETFDSLVPVWADIDRAVVWDAEGVPIVEWRDGQLRFALPTAAAQQVQEDVSAAVAARIERVE